MTRLLILGAAGFAGGHLRSLAESEGMEVIGTARREGQAELRCDLLDPGSIERALLETQPGLIANCAGAASVAASWKDPAGFLEVHETGTRNLLDEVADHAPSSRVLCISSGEVYGAVPESEQPTVEQRPVAPANPYAESKVALERECARAGERGVNAVVARPFSHTGPGQTDAFAPSAFARQVAEAELAGMDRARLSVGNLSPRRDFTDVRDIARAYVLMLAGRSHGPLNVCSGEAIPISRLLELLDLNSKVTIETSTDEERLRPVDVPLMCGSAQALRTETGWRPEIPLERTMGDLLQWWRERLAP